MSTSLLIAKTRIALPNAAALIKQAAEFYREHDFDVAREGDRTRISVSVGHINLSSSETYLVVEIDAKTEVDVMQMKAAIISILQQAAPDADLDCRWTGAGKGNGKLPNFCELTVGEITDLAPHMRRLRLHGKDLDLEAYDTGSIHVRLLIPPRGQENPQWPTLADNGMPVWPSGENTIEQRVYTIRAIDAKAGWIDVDFVMHGDNGPGSAFAMHASPGDVVAMTGPLGTALPEADWMLFAGDETALPAIGRYLAEMPDHVSGHAIIEVGSKSDVIELPTNSQFQVQWLLRDDDQLVERSLLQDAIRSVEMPDARDRIYCWAGVEQGDYKPVHTYWRKELGLDRDNCLAMTFWRKTGC
jgi:NADPH-dependent ferric siderophore reductase